MPGLVIDHNLNDSFDPGNNLGVVVRGAVVRLRRPVALKQYRREPSW